MEHKCDKCGGNNPLSWFADSPLWNEVMRGGDISAQDEYSFICPNCFMQLAIDKGIADMFRVWSPSPLVKLKTATPSGRVWDEEKFKWVDPTSEQGETKEGQ